MIRGSRLTVAQWFGLSVSVLFVIAAAGLIAGIVALGRLTDARELLADRIDPAAIAALQFSTALVDEETGVRGLLLSGDDAFLDPYRRSRRAEPGALADLRRLVPDALTGTVDEAAARADAWRTDYAEPTIAIVRRSGPEAVPVGNEATGKARFDALRDALATLDRGLTAARTRARSELASQADRVLAIFIAFGIVLLAGAAAVGLMLRGVVVRPLHRLAADVRDVSRGEFDRALDARGAREVAELGGDVDTMRRRILSEVAELQHAQQALIHQAQDLERSNAELEQFAYVASHDLQEPLRKVASFCQMLEQRYKGQLDERADQYIAFAVDGAKRMQDLINDLLSFSRVGRITAPHEVLASGDLVDRACRALAAAIEESGATVSTGDLPPVRGDESLLTLVFQNLIGNAIKFRADAPPHVSIAAERDDGFWRFSVADNGIGIESTYADRIFVIFQRLHPRSAYEGTGIGLAMCRKIVEYHGGRIWLDQTTASGSTFKFTLPADQETPTP